MTQPSTVIVPSHPALMIKEHTLARWIVHLPACSGPKRLSNSASKIRTKSVFSYKIIFTYILLLLLLWINFKTLLYSVDAKMLCFFHCWGWKKRKKDKSQTAEQAYTYTVYKEREKSSKYINEVWPLFSFFSSTFFIFIIFIYHTSNLLLCLDLLSSSPALPEVSQSQSCISSNWDSNCLFRNWPLNCHSNPRQWTQL